MIGMIVDAVTILLLIGSITYGFLVSRKVRLLMQTLKELEPLVEAFSDAVDKSEHSVVLLRENLEEAHRQPAETPASQAPRPAEGGTFSTRRDAGESQRDLPGMRVVRDKQDLVRAFFETSRTAEV